MNFNSKLFLYLLFIYIYGCGVKSDPINPPDTAIPSYVNYFLENESSSSNKKAEESKDNTTKDSKVKKETSLNWQ